MPSHDSMIGKRRSWSDGLRHAALRTGLLAGLAVSMPAWAVPPLKTADVPTAGPGVVEVFAGAQYQDTGAIERELPFVELVYGLNAWQEITIEAPYLIVSEPGEPTRSGVGDAVVGTKILLAPLDPGRLGAAVSFELKLANGDRARGLGSGAEKLDIRLRLERQWAWFTGIWNLGYTFVGEPKFAGERQARDDVLFAAFAQEYRVTEETSLLSEVFAETNEEPGGPTRWASNVGFKHDIGPGWQAHAAIGKSLRAGNEGGPRLRIYIGVKYETPL